MNLSNMIKRGQVLFKQTFVISDSYSFECHVCAIVNSNGNKESWFKGNDIATILGYKAPENAIDEHVKPAWRTRWQDLEASAGFVDVPKDWQPNTVFINEPAVWKLLTSSRLDAARPFQDWLFEDVLPALKRNEVYAVSDCTFTNDEQSTTNIESARPETRQVLKVLAKKNRDFVREYKIVQVLEKNLRKAVKLIKMDEYEETMTVFDVPSTICVVKLVKALLCNHDFAHRCRYNTIIMSSDYDFKLMVEDVLNQSTNHARERYLLDEAPIDVEKNDVG